MLQQIIIFYWSRYFLNALGQQNYLLKIKQMNNSNCEDIDINLIIHKLLDRHAKDPILKESQVRALCIKAREVFSEQPMLLELSAPLKIGGDIHGQYSDLVKLFQLSGFPGDVNYLFLGDYVDRGKKSVETMCLLLAYKIKHPQNFFLLRGNHESATINRLYGFYDECKRKYNLKIWKLFSDVFNVMPVTAIIDEKIICMHGGLSPDLKKLQQIMALPRPMEIPDEGLICDLLWSDPENSIKGWANNEERGISWVYGNDVVQKFLEDHDLDLICRAHQVVEEGYEFGFDRKLVTVFSAPNYCGEFNNSGAVMDVKEDLTCSFQILKGHGKK